MVRATEIEPSVVRLIVCVGLVVRRPRRRPNLILDWNR